MLSLFSSDLAIDLGTANTCVYARGKGIVVNEPSIVAINKVTGRVEAVGKDAKDMLGRTPGNIVAIKPMKDGVIADLEVTEEDATYFIKKAHNRNVWCARASSSACRPGSRRSKSGPVKDSACGRRRAKCIWWKERWPPRSAPACRSAEPSGNMIVDIGGGTADIAVISLAGIVYSRPCRSPAATRWTRRSSSK
jgi:rod shape-determining protein MreB